MAAYRQVYDSVTCRLTAKNQDQLRNPTFGSLIWATFAFFTHPTDRARGIMFWCCLSIFAYSGGGIPDWFAVHFVYLLQVW